MQYQPSQLPILSQVVDLDETWVEVEALAYVVVVAFEW